MKIKIEYNSDTGEGYEFFNLKQEFPAPLGRG